MDDSITVPQYAVSPPAACNTSGLPFPPEDVSVCLHRKKNIWKQQTNKKISHGKILPFDKRLTAASKVKAVVKRSTSCWIWPGSHGLSLESRRRKQAENRPAAVHSVDWLGEAEQHWRKFLMESWISRSKTAKTNKVARGPPPSTSCVLSEPHYSSLKTPHAHSKTIEDGRAAGRQIKWR